MSNPNNFEINSKLSEVKVMSGHFQAFCSLNQLDENTSDLLELILVEALNNIIIHSYENNPNFHIQSKYEISNSQLSITLTDYGKEFNIDNNDSGKNENTEDIPEGNWGLDLMNTIADEIIRLHEVDKNILIIKKKIIL